MKATISTPKAANKAYTAAEVKTGRLYRTSNGSLVFKPSLGLGVPSGYYVTLQHFAHPAQNFALKSLRNSSFPWTEVESGTSIAIEQE